MSNARRFSWLFCVVLCLASGLTVSPGLGASVKKNKKNAISGSATSAKDAKAEAEAAEQARIEAQLLASALRSSDHTNGDYIPCTFTVRELFELRQQPALLKLSAAEAEALKEQALVSVFNGHQASTLKGNQQYFASLISDEDFANLTPSQVFTRILADLATAESFHKALNSSNLTNAQFSQIKSSLEGSAQKTDIPEYALELKLHLDALSLIHQSAPITKSSIIGAITETNGKVADIADETGKKAEVQAITNKLVVMVNDEDLKGENTQQILDSARSALSAFARPLDIGCAMSVLDYKETRHAFGPLVADEYIAIQIVVRNLNSAQEFLLHDVELAVDSNPGGAHGRYFSGRDKMMVRALANAQADLSLRNLIVHSVQGVGAIMSSAAAVFPGHWSMPPASSTAPS